MRALVVHAHYEPKSFTSALKDRAVAELTAQGHEVEVSDLYAMKFNPVASRLDFGDPSRSEYTVYSLEQRHCHGNGSLAPDIREEVAKLQAADLLVLSFPVFWFSVPAIMKGWIDRVFLSGVAYGGRRFYDRGGLRGKRALVAATMGSREHMFGPDGVHGTLDGMLGHLLRGSLAYVGMDVLPPFVAWHVPYVEDAERAATLEAYGERLRGVFGAAPMPMPTLDGFDATMRPLVPASVPAGDGRATAGPLTHHPTLGRQQR